MEDNFGHWFAGFFAGEGCFAIAKYQKAVSWSCRAAIRVRDDDAEILQLIKDQTQIGAVNYYKGYKTTNPQVSWQVYTKADVTALVSIFDIYPLRGRKANDFIIWREAVALWNTVHQGSRNFDWTPMVSLHNQLKETRKYQTYNV